MVYDNFFSKKQQTSSRFHINDPMSSNHLAKALLSFLPDSPDVPIVVINIGSDRSTGDSLGPLIGSKLLDKGCPYFHVYGTLDSPVHAKNLKDTMTSVSSKFESPFIIAVDACLGRAESVGMMTIADGPVVPGAAVKKTLPPVGHVHLTGIVNVGGYMEMLVLQNTRLSLVMSMAEVISHSILRSACWHMKRIDLKYPSAE